MNEGVCVKACVNVCERAFVCVNVRLCVCVCVEVWRGAGSWQPIVS